MRDEQYRRLVAQLPCYYCGIEGRTQAAHADKGKGLGIKSSDLTCYPLCGPTTGDPGCHYRIGSGGFFDKEARRSFEKKAMLATQKRLGLK